jgi:hypothetical protein
VGYEAEGRCRRMQKRRQGRKCESSLGRAKANPLWEPDRSMEMSGRCDTGVEISDGNEGQRLLAERHPQNHPMKTRSTLSLPE